VCGEKFTYQRINMSGLKPGPKPIAKTTGKEDQRRRVTPENKPKHPSLPLHKHKKGE
jgi:hypothetical protein